jgi:hypothetical protein
MMVKLVRGNQYHYPGHMACFWQSEVVYINAPSFHPKHVGIMLLRPHGTFIGKERYKRQLRSIFAFAEAT